MAQHSWSNFPRFDRLALALVCLCQCMALSGCASLDGRPVFERWPDDGAGATNQYLGTLREYLAEPPELQPAERERLREAADSSDRVARLKYAFVLSVESEDPVALAEARRHFETLLVAPEPLPAALDSLVRLQLRQVIGQLDILAEVRELRMEEESCTAEQRACGAALAASRDELKNLREKLEAVTRIEQTVNEPREPRRQENGENGDARANEATDAEEETKKKENDNGA